MNIVVKLLKDCHFGCAGYIWFKTFVVWFDVYTSFTTTAFRPGWSARQPTNHLAVVLVKESWTQRWMSTGSLVKNSKSISHIVTWLGFITENENCSITKHFGYSVLGRQDDIPLSHPQWVIESMLLWTLYSLLYCTLWII